MAQEFSIGEGCFGVARISVSWQLLFFSLPPAIALAQQSRERISRTLTLSAVRERSSSIRLGNSTSSLRWLYLTPIALSVLWMSLSSVTSGGS